jgi:hypothetical protein
MFGHGAARLFAVFMEGSLRHSASPSMRRFQGGEMPGASAILRRPHFLTRAVAGEKLCNCYTLIFSRKFAPKKTVKFSAF